MSPLHVTRPALAALELATLARGVVVLDQMAKRAETTIVAAQSLSPGRYFILISGSVAEVQEALAAARETAAEDRVDDLILPDPAPQLRAALASELEAPWEESLAIVETATVCAALWALDRAVKEADVQVLELRLGAGLSGKGVFTLTGPLHMIEAARDVVTTLLPTPSLIRLEVIAQPHPDLPKHLLGAEPAQVRGPRGLRPNWGPDTPKS